MNCYINGVAYSTYEAAILSELGKDTTMSLKLNLELSGYPHTPPIIGDTGVIPAALWKCADVKITADGQTAIVKMKIK